MKTRKAANKRWFVIRFCILIKPIHKVLYQSALAFLLAIVSLPAFSQTDTIPQFNWMGEMNGENLYTKLFKLKDHNSFIVKISYASFWIKDRTAEFIVYQNNGKVKRFSVLYPRGHNAKPIVNRKKIKKKDYAYYWKYLEECSLNNAFDIDASLLNLKFKKEEKEGATITTVIKDGTTYHLQFVQGVNYSNYRSYEPEIYIKKRSSGWEERQKLVDLITGFEKLMTED